MCNYYFLDKRRAERYKSRIREEPGQEIAPDVASAGNPKGESRTFLRNRQMYASLAKKEKSLLRCAPRPGASFTLPTRNGSIEACLSFASSGVNKLRHRDSWIR